MVLMIPDAPVKNLVYKNELKSSIFVLQMSEHQIVFDMLQYLNETRDKTKNDPSVQRFVLTQSLFEFRIELTEEQIKQMWNILTPQQLEQ